MKQRPSRRLRTILQRKALGAAMALYGPDEGNGMTRTNFDEGDWIRRFGAALETVAANARPRYSPMPPMPLGIRPIGEYAARVSAVLGMRRQDYFQQGSRGWLRLHEKGGKRHDVPAHHRAAEALDAYLDAAGLEDGREALFQSVDRAGDRLTGRPLSRRVVLAMIKRRASAAGLPPSTCCHTFRATGITAYLSNGGTLEHAQQIAGHASPKTTKLYDRTSDAVTVDEIERIVI